MFKQHIPTQKFQKKQSTNSVKKLATHMMWKYTEGKTDYVPLQT